MVDGKAQALTPVSHIHCNNSIALRDAALKGLGLAMLPDYYVQDALASGLTGSAGRLSTARRRHLGAVPGKPATDT